MARARGLGARVYAASESHEDEQSRLKGGIAGRLGDVFVNPLSPLFSYPLCDPLSDETDRYPNWIGLGSFAPPPWSSDCVLPTIDVKWT